MEQDFVQHVTLKHGSTPGLRSGAPWWPLAALFVTLAAIFAVVARRNFHRYSVSLPAATGIYARFVLYLELILILGIE